ncbi:hypothetical protein BX666DRAFT_1869754, partial [Dichotomocladium elegans]
HYHMDTNNYVKSWHHLLKEGYLGRMAGQRVDVLVHILWDTLRPGGGISTLFLGI